MLRPENAYKNALYVGYSTPNLPAKAMLPKEIQKDEAFYPTVGLLGMLRMIIFVLLEIVLARKSMSRRQPPRAT